MLAREIAHELRRAAEPIYGVAEAEAIARLLLSELWGADARERALEPHRDYATEALPQLLEQIAAARPVQYILGHVEFCGMRLAIREGALIPRPETEELVAWGVELGAALKAPRVADICCGSGAIALAMARSLRGSDVVALDLSTQALELARENSELLGTEISIVEGDALQGVENYLDGEFDIILSNPPYIPISEAEAMRANVVDYEPHLALFVDDCDPLIFYRTIARSSRSMLRGGGALLFEIHENFAQAMVLLLTEMGYVDIELREDAFQKPRMICARAL